jgi:hypothetical protein
MFIVAQQGVDSPVGDIYVKPAFWGEARPARVKRQKSGSCFNSRVI